MPLLIFLAFAVLGTSCVAQNTDATAVQKMQDAGAHYREAEAHRSLALKYLQEAAEAASPDRLSAAQSELNRAAEEYLACASSLDDKIDETTRVLWAASGLLASYHAPSALNVIFEHAGAQHDPRIMRIKADALLALGSGKEAALAYEQWIGLGKCRAAYRNWPGEPTVGHPLVLLMPKGTNDPCAALAPELRVRLETLQRLFDHPNNLPKKNYE